MTCAFVSMPLRYAFNVFWSISLNFWDLTTLVRPYARTFSLMRRFRLSIAMFFSFMPATS